MFALPTVMIGKSFSGETKNRRKRKKEVTATNGLVDELIDQLSVKTVFTIPIFGGIKIAESVVVMWIIMAVVIVGIDFPDAELKRGESGKETVVSGSVYRKILWFFEGLLGEEGKVIFLI